MFNDVLMILAVVVVALPLIIGFLLMAGVLVAGFLSALVLLGEEVMELFDETKFHTLVQSPRPNAPAR